MRGLVPSADIEIGPELTDRERREGLYRRPVSIENARQQLGYEPRFPTMAEGLSDSVDKYRTWHALQ